MLEMTGEEKNLVAQRRKLPYRQGAVGMVINSGGEFLIAQLTAYKEDQWRFPGGGMDPGETPEQTALRELREELRSDKFEVITPSRHKNRFEWPNESIVLRFRSRGEIYRGQEQHHVLMRFTGGEDELVIDPNEVRRVAWVKREDLPKYFIFPGQMEFVDEVLNDLSEYL